MKKLTKLVAPLLLLAATSASAVPVSTLSGNLTVDNTHTTFLSLDDSIAGTAIASGDNWGYTTNFTGVELLPGQDYFLHIQGNDLGGPGALIGDFSLSGDSHVFGNGLTHLLTNTLDWAVSTVGWFDYITPTYYGYNGAYPWGYRPGISGNAQWIWSNDFEYDDTAYFSVAINATDEYAPPSAVPLPASIWLFLSGLAGLGYMQRRKQEKSV